MPAGDDSGAAARRSDGLSRYRDSDTRADTPDSESRHPSKSEALGAGAAGAPLTKVSTVIVPGKATSE